MRVVVYQGKKLFQREREYHINLSTPMNLYNMYIILIQIHMCKFQLKKKKKKFRVQEKFYGYTISKYIYIYIYIYIEILIIDFQFKLGHVACFVKTLFVTLPNEIVKNK